MWGLATPTVFFVYMPPWFCVLNNSWSFGSMILQVHTLQTVSLILPHMLLLTLLPSKSRNCKHTSYMYLCMMVEGRIKMVPHHLYIDFSYSIIGDSKFQINWYIWASHVLSRIAHCFPATVTSLATFLPTTSSRSLFSIQRYFSMSVVIRYPLSCELCREYEDSQFTSDSENISTDWKGMT